MPTRAAPQLASLPISIVLKTGAAQITQACFRVAGSLGVGDVLL